MNRIEMIKKIVLERKGVPGLTAPRQEDVKDEFSFVSRRLDKYDRFQGDWDNADTSDLVSPEMAGISERVKREDHVRVF